MDLSPLFLDMPVVGRLCLFNLLMADGVLCLELVQLEGLELAQQEGLRHKAGSCFFFGLSVEGRLCFFDLRIVDGLLFLGFLVPLEEMLLLEFAPLEGLRQQNGLGTGKNGGANQFQRFRLTSLFQWSCATRSRLLVEVNLWIEVDFGCAVFVTGWMG
jgi:hypothetical protein